MFWLKRRKKEFLILIITFLFVFLIGEFFVRVHFFGLANSFSSLKGVSGIAQAGYIQASDNCEIIYELKPNIKNGRYKFSRFETNSQGLRDKEYSIEKPPGVYRVAVLGDSLTMPLGVDIENAYHSILEERFKAEGTNMEFINFGVEGYNTDQYLATLKYKAAKYDPDMILVGFYVSNDISSTNDITYMCNYTDPNKKNDFLKSYFVDFIKTKSINIGSKLKKEENEKSIGGEEIKLSVQDWERFTKVMNEFLNFGHTNKIPIVFVLLPGMNYDDLAVKLHPISLHYLCNSTFVIDLLPSFLRRANKELDKEFFLKEYYIYPSNDHPNDRAHEIFADIIYAKLKDYNAHPNGRYEVCINQLTEGYDTTKEVKIIRVGGRFFPAYLL